MGRCTMWAQKDKCGQFCPVACGLCQLCEGHPDRDAYRKFYRKARFKPRFWSPRCKVSAWEPQPPATAASGNSIACDATKPKTLTTLV